MNQVEISRQLPYRLVWLAVGESAEKWLLTKTFRSRKVSWRRYQTKRKRIKSQASARRGKPFQQKSEPWAVGREGSR